MSRTCCASWRRRSSARLARRSGDFDAAEDAVQEALLAAADHWSRDGIPADPRGWLSRTAGLRLIDLKRSEQSRRRRETLTAMSEAQPTPGLDAGQADRDDTLGVLFMCCHPALTPASAIALTLRAVGGLTTAQIARAFLVPEATMAQRISRAKQPDQASGVPFRMPTPDERPARVRLVLRVLYLIFNEGYASTAGAELHRAELSDEAIRLARMAQRLLPDDPEVAGLLALMLLDRRPPPGPHDGRRRPGPAGRPGSELDGTGRGIAEGVALLDDAIGGGRVGEYQVQAAIAAIHDRASRAEDTDWPQILALYGLLERMTGNPVVTLNRAVATAMVHGPSAGLAVLDGVEDRLAGSLPARRGPGAPARDGR